MKRTSVHTGTVILTFDRDPIDQHACIFLGLKPPENENDAQRTRKRIGMNCWTPLGGARKRSDRSQKHAAARELLEESGYVWQIPLGNLHKIGLLKAYNVTTLDTSWERARLQWIVHVYKTVIPGHLRDAYRIIPARDGTVEYTKLRWYSIRRLPWKRMIEGDRLWLSRLIKGEQLWTELLLDPNTGKVLDHECTLVRFR